MTDIEERCFKALVALYEATNYYTWQYDSDVSKELSNARVCINLTAYELADQYLEGLYDSIPQQTSGGETSEDKPQTVDADWWDDDLRKAMWKAKHLLEFKPTRYVEQFRTLSTGEIKFTSEFVNSKDKTLDLNLFIPNHCCETVAYFKIQYK